jgi:hypothetical protein
MRAWARNHKDRCSQPLLVCSAHIEADQGRPWPRREGWPPRAHESGGGGEGGGQKNFFPPRPAKQNRGRSIIDTNHTIQCSCLLPACKGCRLRRPAIVSRDRGYVAAILLCAASPTLCLSPNSCSCLGASSSSLA